MANPNPIKIGISGSLGQMSQSVINLALKDENFIITSLFEPYKKVIDNDFIIVNNEKIYHLNDIKTLINSEIIIDFSHDNNTYNLIKFAKENNKKLVIGTTKLSKETISEMNEAAKHIPIFYSPNMSYGINAFFSLIPYFIDKFKDFDIEIVETHHRRKKDAPSGTALKIFDIIKSINKDSIPIFDRTKLDKPRDKNEIGISSIRGGCIYGNHTILFIGESEEIEITHRMLNKESLSKGTLIAAKYIYKKEKGLFYYEDLIKENFI